MGETAGAVSARTRAYTAYRRAVRVDRPAIRVRGAPREPLAEGRRDGGVMSFDWVGSRVALLLGLVA
jgi:hypothetical protein